MRNTFWKGVSCKICHGGAIDTIIPVDGQEKTLNYYPPFPDTV